MRVVALVEYEVLGDDEYRNFERFEIDYIQEQNARYWRNNIYKQLLACGIVVKRIKEISVEYVRD